MNKPIDQAAIRAAMKSSFNPPNWLIVGNRVYFPIANSHVKILGWIGNIVSISHQDNTLQVPLSQLAAPRLGEECKHLDLSIINHPIYNAIATTFIDDLNAIKVLPGRDAILTSFPDLLAPNLCHALKTNGITQLYSHQRQALSELQKERSIALTTPTASGKSLAFMPHAFLLALSKRQTSLLIYPLRALATDQFNKLIALNDALPSSERLFIARCTGDVSLEIRKGYFQGTRIPDIVVISPDVLHHQLYQTKNSTMRLWQEFLSRLGLVVCDESHSYTSSFGIHFANVLRRLRLALANSNHPTGKISWVISTATIANPLELASQLSGLSTSEITLIDSSGAKQSERTLLIMKPQAAPNFMAATLVRTLLTFGLKGLLFVNSRRSAKQIFSLLSYQSGGKVNGVELFHGSLTAERRKVIIDKLEQGNVKVLVTTNALEAGVDLPNLDFVILRGSTSLNSFWQRAGRAGRANPGAIVFVPDAANHIDYYYANNSDRLFDSVEKIKLQLNYPSILASHLLCAGAEGGIPAQSVQSYFGTGSDYLAAELHRQNKLYWSPRQFLWSKGYPHRDVSLRGISDNTIELVDIDTGEVLEEMTLDLAHRETHQGAIYLTTEEGETINWRCQSLDLTQNKALLKKFDSDDLRTTPDVELNVTPATQLDSPKTIGTAIKDGNLRLSLWWGTISEQVGGYDELKLLYAPTCTQRACPAWGEPQPKERQKCCQCGQRLSQRLTTKVLEKISFNEPLITSFEAPIMRIEVNLPLSTAIAKIASQLRDKFLSRYRTEEEIPRELSPLFECHPVHLALHSLSHLLTKSIPLLFLASEKDVNTLTVKRSCSNAGTAHQIVVYLYDAVKDGCGTTEALFCDWEESVAKAIEIATECDCGELGCPRCLHSHSCPESNEALSKQLGIWFLEQF
jgi:DEAD/DEAH box helicase domain-containing protein